MCMCISCNNQHTENTQDHYTYLKEQDLNLLVYAGYYSILLAEFPTPYMEIISCKDMVILPGGGGMYLRLRGTGSMGTLHPKNV